MTQAGPKPGETYLFLHMMKTGGTSLLAHIADNFGPEQRYPPEDSSDGFDAAMARYRSMGMLREAAARSPRPVMFAGHFPYLAVDVVRPDVTITILREPVERAISALRQVRAGDGPEPRSLEELYEQHPTRWSIVQNYQVRQFALTAEELEESASQVDAFFPGNGATARDVPQLVYREVDETGLTRAIENLGSVEVVGLQSSFGEVLDELRDRFNWRIPGMYRRRVVADAEPVPEALRRRITEDSAADLEFYAAARRIVTARRR